MHLSQNTGKKPAREGFAISGDAPGGNRIDRSDLSWYTPESDERRPGLQQQEDQMNQKRGFTLLELLVVVIIVGILASVALPQFQKMALRARVAEGETTLGAILTAELLYYQEYATFAKEASRALLLVSIPADNTTWFNYTITDANTSDTKTEVIAKGSATTINGAKVAATVILTGTISDKGARTLTKSGL
jgi:prepilin-type N-terminal cleavage/methylation domain-containing protein